MGSKWTGVWKKEKKVLLTLIVCKMWYNRTLASARPTSAPFSSQRFNVCFRARAPGRERFGTAAPKSCRGCSFLLRRKSNHTPCGSQDSSTSGRYVWTAVPCLEQLVPSSPRKAAIFLVRQQQPKQACFWPNRNVAGLKREGLRASHPFETHNNNKKKKSQGLNLIYFCHLEYNG